MLKYNWIIENTLAEGSCFYERKDVKDRTDTARYRSYARCLGTRHIIIRGMGTAMFFACLCSQAS